MVTALATAVMCLLIVRTIWAGEQGPYQPVGAPADPKVPAQWNRYHDHRETTAILKSLAAKHPQCARLQSLGKSYGGREMWLLTITNFSKGEDHTKPAFWIDGALHANEIQGTEVTLYTQHGRKMRVL